MSKHRKVLFMNAFWAIPVVFVIRILRPVYHVRISKIFSERIGHFVPDAAELIIRMSLEKNDIRDFFYLGNVSNLQWAKMIKQKLKIKGTLVRIIGEWNRYIPGGKSHRIGGSSTLSRDSQGLFQRFDARIPFTDIEDENCRQWLKKFGWKEGEPFICLLVRDSAYLNSTSLYRGDSSFSYHNYRDSDIETYLSAIKFFTSQNVWILRMGRVMITPLPKNMEKVIDYAFEDDQSDLLDVWLFANCTGCISTASGPDVIPWVYRVPQLNVNALPLTHAFSFTDSIWVPKNLFWQQTQIPLSISEYLEHGYLETNQYEESGIEIRDLSELEILEAAKEFWKRISNHSELDQGNRHSQEKFWRAFRAWNGYDELHGWIHPNFRVADSWLQKKV
jgi:putative glycosyltransferase (TIGR04372 family)